MRNLTIAMNIECASIFDICRRLSLLDDIRYQKGRELLLRIVAMLTKMVRVDVALAQED